MSENSRQVDSPMLREPDAEVSLHFHHIGIAVPALDSAIRMYEDLFGYRLQSGPFEDPIQRVAVCFLVRGEAIEPVIELVAPLAEESPIKSVLLKGGGAYHICFETSDIEKTLTEVAGKGCVIVSQPVPAVAFEGRRIAWFFTPTRQLVELVEAADNTIGNTGSLEEAAR